MLSDSVHYVPILAKAELFNQLWSRDGLYLPEWNKEPNPRWFFTDANGSRIAFFAGLACLDEHDRSIGFTNGRHRTRWLLNRNPQVIPICIPHEELEAWLVADLIEETKQPIEFKVG